MSVNIKYNKGTLFSKKKLVHLHSYSLTALQRDGKMNLYNTTTV